MKITNKIREMSLQGKISSIYIMTNMLVVIVNIILLMGIGRMSKSLDVVYQDNLNLNKLSKVLTAVQDSMTDYLNVKTSDVLEDYYRNSQEYAHMIAEFEDKVTNITYDRMKRNIRHMSEEYLRAADYAVEAKRGRNVEKYRVRYENATQLYNYIDNYIYSLNNQQFQGNSENYSKLSNAFRFFEIIIAAVMFIVTVGNICIIIYLAGMISRPLKEKELMMEAHLKDAQLKYLQAQINPHFLFNTLNAGAQLAMMEEADRTYKYVQRMADFFRYNVRKGEKTVTIREEIELIDNYIYILNVRFSGDIHYEKNINEELLDVAIPSMTLQPIVENCVNHGIREMAGKGKILISVYRSARRACISIRDNGKGMSQDVIDKVMNGTYREENKTGDSNGVGMDNVLARLRLFTGYDDVMTMRSEGKDKGTEILIYLPIAELEEENV